MASPVVESPPTPGQYELSHLRSLEAEAIHIIREVAAEFERPVLLFSGGKDSIVMLHLAIKAFAPGRLPFPVMHVDTGHNFEEVIATRDALVERYGLRLVVASVEETSKPAASSTTGRRATRCRPSRCCGGIRENKFDAAFGGARRDEEKARAKERVFSFRDEFGQWDPKLSAPNCGTSTTAATARVSTSAFFSRCPTGPSTTSGPTSAPKTSRCRPSTTHTPRQVFQRDGMLLAVHKYLQPTPRGDGVRDLGAVSHRRRRDVHRMRGVHRLHRRGGDRRDRGVATDRTRRHSGR